MTLENIDVRKEVADSGITYKQIALRMGINHGSLSRLMRKPLSQKNRMRILDALAQLQADQAGEGCYGVQDTRCSGLTEAKAEGYGKVYQDIMRDPTISIEAKAIYSYLSSIAGVDRECSLSLGTMRKELSIGMNRLRKYIHELVQNQMVDIKRTKQGSLYSSNTYIVR